MKVAMVPDVPNWAFDRNISAIIKYNPEIQIDKYYPNNSHVGKNKNIWKHQYVDKYDLTYFADWLMVNEAMAPRVITEITSHNHIYYHRPRAKNFFPILKAIVCKSRILYNIVKGRNPNVYYAAGGVHEDLFVPVKKERRKRFTIGWVGQPTKGGYGNARPTDVKGYTNLLLPLVNYMKKYKDIKFKILANVWYKAQPYSEMPNWYNDVDVQICTSVSEGAPNPMFEAASCGLPLITTRVGSISELIVHGTNGFFVDTYNKVEDIPDRIKQFEKYILKLKNDRDICDQMGKNNRAKVVKEWAWRIRAKQWKRIFEDLMKKDK